MDGESAPPMTVWELAEPHRNRPRQMSHSSHFAFHPASHPVHLRRLVGVSAPAVPPITAPAPAPRPRPRIAPPAAPPAAPIPTFLARRLPRPLLRLLLEDFEDFEEL